MVLHIKPCHLRGCFRFDALENYFSSMIQMKNFKYLTVEIIEPNAYPASAYKTSHYITPTQITTQCLTEQQFKVNICYVEQVYLVPARIFTWKNYLCEFLSKLIYIWARHPLKFRNHYRLLLETFIIGWVILHN